MANLNQRDNRLLNELVKDCITYKLDTNEAVEYIKQDTASLLQHLHTRQGRHECYQTIQQTCGYQISQG